ALALLSRRHVADHEDLRVARDREIGLDEDAAAIEGDAEALGQRRRLHPGGPEDGPRRDPLAADDHPRLVDALDQRPQADLDAAGRELLAGDLAEPLVHAGEDPAGALEEDHPG